MPGDREEDRERERSIGDQLNNIISHIEVNRLAIQHIEVRADHKIQINEYANTKLLIYKCRICLSLVHPLLRTLRW